METASPAPLPIQVGDIVNLSGRGPDMTICSFADLVSGGKKSVLVNVAWITPLGLPQSASYPLAVLRVVEQPRS